MTPDPCMALLDCNNFYASCERRLDPALQGVPIAVLSSNDGCIIARSDEVKALGVPMGAPYFKVQTQLQQAGVRVFSANFDYYADVSAQLVDFLLPRVPRLEVYSIDESFLDFTGLARFHDVVALAQRLRTDILHHLGLPVSIGIGPGKVLAKVANRLAKRRRTGVESLMDARLQEQELRALPAADVWGVGPANARTLALLGIHTAWHLRQADPDALRASRSVVEARLVLELRGQPCLPLVPEQPAKKNIGTSRSFGTEVTDVQGLRSAVAAFICTAGAKLRRQGSAAHAVTVHVSTNRFRGPKGYYSRAATARLTVASSRTPVLLAAAWRALAQVYRPGLSYKKAGVLLTELVPEGQRQGSLFEAGGPPGQQARARTLEGVADRYNRRQGRLVLQWGPALTRQRGWQPLSQHRSTGSGLLPSLTPEQRDRVRVTRFLPF